MSGSTLIEVFGHIVFSFTRGVTEHYNPELKNLNTRQSLLATILCKAQVENGIIFLLMSLFISQNHINS